MNDETSNETAGTEEGRELQNRRLFLQSMGKWSGAAIAAAVFGGHLACISVGGQLRRLGQPPGWWRWGVDKRSRWGQRWVDKRWRLGDGSTAVAMAAEVHGSIANW
jgi:hypothetical protein